MVAVEVEDFVDVARRYCCFVEAALAQPHIELRSAASLLAELYFRALRLPDAEPSDEPDLEDKAMARGPIPALANIDLYWEVFDPYNGDETEPVVASLTDDLLDVRADLCRGLELYNAGRVDDAIWHWNFQRECHWGDHAVDALRALQRAMQPQP